MKNYYLGSLEIKNINILKKELAKDKKYKYVGIQRSLEHLYNHHGCNNIEEYILQPSSSSKNVFELPLFDNFNELLDIAIISGYLNKNDFVIERVLL